MKKLLALVLSMLLVLGCASFAMAEEEKPLIGILAPATTHGWVGGVAYFAQEAAEELELNYVMLTSSTADEMSGQIEQLISMGAKAIVVWPQFTGVEVAAEMALAEGIIIYNFDMIINVADEYKANIYQLTGDNYGMGVKGAEYVAEKLDGKGKVVILGKPAAGNVHDDRVGGFKDTIAEIAPDIEIIAEIASDFTREAGLSDMADALIAYEQIDAVFSLDDETSIGALQAITEAGRTDVKIITGGGGCQEYFNMMPGYEDMWVASATYLPNMITYCVENVVKLLAGEEIEPLVVIETTIVDKDNVADFLNPDSPY